MNVRGQALVEHLVVSGALAFALFAPWAAGESPAARVLAALARWYRNYAFVLALG